MGLIFLYKNQPLSKAINNELRQEEGLMKSRLRLTMVLLLVVFVVVGCGQKKKIEQGKKVEIPKEVSQGENAEPKLRVYLADEDSIVDLAMEEYIKGVVAAEMDPDWPLAALAAQAIQARTFTLQKIAEQGTLPERDAHASTDIKEFQAYDPKKINNNVRQAVDTTRGLVAVYKGEYVRSWFHAYCGGITATPEAGLNYTKPVPDYFKPVENPCREYIDKDSEFWTQSFSKGEVREAVQAVTKTDPGNFFRIDISKSENGRAVTFKIGSVTVSAAELRLALGSTEMRSTVIDTPTVTGDEVKFVGRGYGHGVGLCQWGAKGWAEKGRSAEEIVKAFFPGVEIQKLWD